METKIDIEKAKKEFNKYVSKYNIEDSKIKLKINHIMRVADNSKIIAKSLNLNEEEIKLAELIGLLHDIGRFEQIKRYNTFKDSISINHGKFGADILFKEGLIRKFITFDKYDNIIEKSIINHNKTNIEENLTEKELLFSKIVRDADKLDILYILTIGDVKTVWETENMEDEIISEEIYKEFLINKKINYSKIKSSADLLVCHFAYTYDINFKKTCEIIRNEKYIEKMYQRFNFKDLNTKNKIDEIYKLSKKNLKFK